MSLDKETFFFDNLEIIEYSHLKFNGDYFEVVVNGETGPLVGAYSINGTLVVPPRYVDVELINERFICHRTDGDKDEFSKYGVKL